MSIYDYCIIHGSRNCGCQQQQLMMANLQAQYNRRQQQLTRDAMERVMNSGNKKTPNKLLLLLR